MAVSPMIFTCKETEIYILLWQNFFGNDNSYFIQTDVLRWACQGKQCPPGGWKWGQEWSQLLTGSAASVRCPLVLLQTLKSGTFSVSFDNIQEVLNRPLKVFENGSGEDLAVFCRSVISYCGKKGVEVKETMIRQKKTRKLWSDKKRDQTKIPKINIVLEMKKEI